MSLIWRKSAAVLIAVPHISGPRTRCDYDLCFVRRAGTSRFMPNSLSFPEGAVEDADPRIADSFITANREDTVQRVAAIREVAEETSNLQKQRRYEYLMNINRNVLTGIEESSIECQTPISDWLTPEDEVRRQGPKGGFETRFFSSDSRPATFPLS